MIKLYAFSLVKFREFPMKKYIQVGNKNKVDVFHNLVLESLQSLLQVLVTENVEVLLWIISNFSV